MATRLGNLDEDSQKMFLRMSLIGLAVAIGTFMALDNIDASLLLRGLVVIPFFLSATWLLQGIGRT